VIEETQVIAHKTHQPDFLLDLFHSDSLPGEGLAEIDLQRSHADPATACDDDGAIVDSALEVGRNGT
jgi:hypothetical protein